MDASPEHIAAVVEACRLPALEARLALLASADTARSEIRFYEGTYPAPTDPLPTDPPMVALPLTARAGVIVSAPVLDPGTQEQIGISREIVIDTPLEASVINVDPVAGGVPGWAMIVGPAGDWWGNMTVSVEGGAGELQLVPTGVENGEPVVRWFVGTPARVSGLVVRG